MDYKLFNIFYLINFIFVIKRYKFVLFGVKIYKYIKSVLKLSVFLVWDILRYNSILIW